jgi:HAMP domain-containing protein
MNQISKEINEMALDLVYLSTNKILINATIPLSEKIEAIENFKQYSNNKYESISLYNNKGIVIADTTSQNIGKNLSIEQFFIHSFKGEIYLDKYPKKITPDKTIFHFSSPIYNTKNTITGVLDLQISYNFINDIMDNALFYSINGKNDIFFKLYLLLEDGSVIYSNENSNNNSSNDLNSKAIHTNVSPIHLNTLDNITNKSQENFQVTIPESTKRYMNYTGEKWNLVINGDLSSIFKDYNKIITEFFILSSSILIISLIIITFGIRKITGPIAKLKDAALEISNKQLQKEIPIHGSGELKDLSISLEAMRRNIVNLNKILLDKVNEITKELEKSNNTIKIKESELKKINEELDRSYKRKEEFSNNKESC